MTFQQQSLPYYGAVLSEVSVPTAPVLSIAQLPDKYQPPFGAISRKSTTTIGILNILCTSLDGTTLTIPYAISKCGLFIGVLLFFGYAMGTSLTLHFICVSSRKLRAASYTEIVHRLFGQSCGLLFSGILFLVLFATLVGFLILMRQIASELLILAMGTTKVPTTVIMVFFALLCFPFMLAESLHKLRYSCYLGFLSIMLVLGCLMYAVQHPTTQYKVINFHNVKYLPSSFSDLLEAIPVFTMLYISHFNVLGVFTQLEKPTPHRMSQVINCSVAVMTALFISFGVVGYFVFFTLCNGQAVDNILSAFPPHHRALLLGRFCLLITLMCTIPVMLIPARSILMEYYEDALEYWEVVPPQQGGVPHTADVSQNNRATAGSSTQLAHTHDGRSMWLDHTIFANRTRPTHAVDEIPHRMGHIPTNEGGSSDIEERHPHNQDTAVPSTPTFSESPPPASSPATEREEEDVGVGFEGLESHWREWRALVAPLHSLDPRGYSDFQRELDDAERAARVARLARQTAAQVETAHDNLMHAEEKEDWYLLGGESADTAGEAKGGLELLPLDTRDSSPAGPAPNPAFDRTGFPITGIGAILKWRCLRLPRGGEASHRQQRARYTFTVAILTLVLLTASLIPDSVSRVWQVAGSSVGKLYSL